MESFDQYDTRTFFAGGDVIGLDKETVTLLLVTTGQHDSQRRVATHLEAGNGPFGFTTALGHGAQYLITVETNPPGRACSVENGQGTIDGADPSVVVRCIASRVVITESDRSSAAEICVATINRYRAINDLPPYERWREGEPCADGQATSDGAAGVFRTLFRGCGETAENECGRWPGGPVGTMIPQCLGVMYEEGPGQIHFNLMMSTQFQKVACGFGVAPDGRLWAVQNFL